MKRRVQKIEAELLLGDSFLDQYLNDCFALGSDVDREPQMRRYALDPSLLNTAIWTGVTETSEPVDHATD